MEEQLRGISSLDHVESTSIEGASRIFIQFQDGLSRREADRVITNLQQAVNRVRDLPALAEKPVVEELTTGDRPLLNLSVASPVNVGRRMRRPSLRWSRACKVFF